MIEVKKKWTKEEFDKLMKDYENNVPIKDLADKYNRTEFAILKKISRGHSENDKRSDRRKHKILIDDKLKESFIDDYVNNKLSVKDMISKYKFKDRQQMYNVANKLSIKKN